MLVERRALALSQGRLCFSPWEAGAEGLPGLAKKGPPVAVVSAQMNLFGLLSIYLYLNPLAVSGPNNLLLMGDFLSWQKEAREESVNKH